MPDKHTPEPWRIETEGDGEPYMVGSHEIAIFSGNAIVCAVWPLEPEGAQLANARLIVRAPELLTILQSLVDAVDRAYPDEGLTKQHIDDARDVIKQATGGN